MAFQARQPVAQLGQVFGAMLVDVDRVQPERCMQGRVGDGQVPQPLPVALIDPQHHHALHAECLTVLQDLRTVGIEVGKVQMGVGVDQRHVRPRECAA